MKNKPKLDAIEDRAILYAFNIAYSAYTMLSTATAAFFAVLFALRILDQAPLESIFDWLTAKLRSWECMHRVLKRRVEK